MAGLQTPRRSTLITPRSSHQLVCASRPASGIDPNPEFTRRLRPRVATAS